MARRFPPRTELTKPKLILCEGPSDEAFFRALLRKRGLPECCIRHTGDADESGHGGIDKFELILIGIKSWKGFFDLTDILIVADNDLLKTPTNFEKIQTQLSNADYPVPATPLAKNGANPSITVLMLPWTNAIGNLETLCLSAAEKASPAIAGHVGDFAKATGALAWCEDTLRGKMKLRSLLAAKHKPNPFIGLGKVWTNNGDETMIPLDHESFNGIADELSKFMT